jgi:endonuclease/exonuclease/phosphatase family metal-dependent hydrolase
MDWEISSPRMVTWGRLREVSGREILMLNTHMPYGRNADEARRQATQVVLCKIAELPPDLPLFVTGDFNAPAEGEMHSQLTTGLEDAWKSARETRGPEGTLHGFGTMTRSRRIDWILHRNAGQTLQAETIQHTANGLYPSDHYPVSATFFLDPATQSVPAR